MKAITAVLAIGAILSTTLATPVDIGDVAVERRDVQVDITARQLPNVPGLPELPPIAVPTKPADLAPALQTALTQVLGILGGISELLWPQDRSHWTLSLTRLPRKWPSS